MATMEAMLTGVPVLVGEQPAASKLSGPRVSDVDLSWHYLPPPFSLGHICKNKISKSCDDPIFLLSDTVIVCYL